jgi:hypothetical protein
MRKQVTVVRGLEGFVCVSERYYSAMFPLLTLQLLDSSTLFILTVPGMQFQVRQMTGCAG